MEIAVTEEVPPLPLRLAPHPQGHGRAPGPLVLASVLIRLGSNRLVASVVTKQPLRHLIPAEPGQRPPQAELRLVVPRVAQQLR